jgi:hypothetical protein
VLAHVHQAEGQHVEAALVAGQLAVEEVAAAGVEGLKGGRETRAASGRKTA